MGKIPVHDSQQKVLVTVGRIVLFVLGVALVCLSMGHEQWADALRLVIFLGGGAMVAGSLLGFTDSSASYLDEPLD